MQIVIGDFGTVTKGLLKGLENLEVGGRVKNIQTTALLRTARILRWVLEIWWDCPRKSHVKIPLEFWDTYGSPKLGQTTRPYHNQESKNRTNRIEDFPARLTSRVKFKESEKKDKYLDLAWELKNCGTWKWRLYQMLWRCPWCNGYYRRKWTRWLEFKSWTRLIAFHIALIPPSGGVG